MKRNRLGTDGTGRKTTASDAAPSLARVIVIGESPGPKGEARLPLFPYPARSAGYRLAQMTGLARAGYLEHFRRLNLMPSHRGAAWPVATARDAADNLAGGGLLGGYHVLLLGAKVWRAFGGASKDFSYCRWYKRYGRLWSPGYYIAVIPHPSGRNRLYNRSRVRQQVVAFLRALAKGKATQRYAFTLSPPTRPPVRRRLHDDD